MHETELEQRLRMALRDEADRLPLRVDAERLEARLAARRREARSGRLGLLAAAVGVVAFGIAAVGLNGGLPAGIVPGIGPATPVPCTPVAVDEDTAPPAILLVDAGGVAHRGGLDRYRLPDSSTVVVRGRGPGESRLAPGTTTLEVTTAEGACLLRVELEVRPARDGASPVLTDGAEGAAGDPVTSLTVSAPPAGAWRATIRATFRTTGGEITMSQTSFELVSAAPGTSEPSPSASSSIPLPAGFVPFEPREGAEVVEEVVPRWSGSGTRHSVQVPRSMTSSTTVSVSCVDGSATVDSEGVTTDLDAIAVMVDGDTHEVPCIGEQSFALTPPLADRPIAIEIVVPADVAYTVLVERLALPTELPTLDLGGPREVEGASDNAAPDWGRSPGTIRTTIGTIDEGFSQEAVFACLGPGTMTVEFRTPGSDAADPPVSSSSGACLGEAEGLTIAVGQRGAHEVLIEADVRSAWHAIAGSDGVLPPFDPPGLHMTSLLGTTDVGDTVATGQAGCGARFVLAGAAAPPETCAPPEWPDLSGQPSLLARTGGQLQVRLDEDWRWREATVRAAPIIQSGRDEAPVDIRDLSGTIEDDVLVIPVDLSTLAWVVRIDATVAAGDREYRAPIFFVVDVEP